VEVTPVANTSYLRRVVEPYVRQELGRRYSTVFLPKAIGLTSGGQREFNAVSHDGEIIASITTAGGKTVSGRVSSGKVRVAESELYYLTLAAAATRLLVVTSPDFHRLLTKKLDGRLAPGISLELIELPEEMAEQVARVQAEASVEMSPAIRRYQDRLPTRGRE
jgi:hypothetical protein